MQEDFLWYVWQRQYFNKSVLRTHDGRLVQVLKPGILNRDAGPDFEHAQLKIGDVTWAGQVEMHLKSSDWNKHRHQSDPLYNAVILHVVWEHDTEVRNEHQAILPALELKPLVKPDLLAKYYELKGHLPQFIACEKSIDIVPVLQKTMMLERVLTHRLERKSEMLLQWFSTNTNDWEETAWQWLAWCFGFKLNQEPMLQLAYRAPLGLLKKVHASGGSLEAALLGIGGLFHHLPEVPEVMAWKREFDYLLAKHRIEPTAPLAWKRLKTRPGNFPAVRVIQLATFLKNINLGFGKFIRFESEQELLKWFQFKVKASIDWPSQPYLNNLNMGSEARNTLMVNFLSVFMAGYAQYRQQPELMEKALALLLHLKPDKNQIISSWQQLGLPAQNAFDSQALLEWHQHYCKPLRCLDCQIGAWLVK